MKALAVGGIEVVAASDEHVVDGNELHDLTLGQIRGLVEDQPAVVNVRAKRRHSDTLACPRPASRSQRAGGSSLSTRCTVAARSGPRTGLVT